jgi:hypothetical protein
MQSLLQVAFSAVALLIPAHREDGPVQHHLLARVHGPVRVLARPGGAPLATLGSRTAFGSLRVLSVVNRHGRWLHVATADLPSARDGWIDAGAPGVTLGSTRVSIVIHLRVRTLELRRDNHVLRRVTVGVGAPSSPTPTGRFAVTDKLRGAAFSAAYGCCILALSARQTHLPAGWTGGDRIAIHGTNAPATIGRALSTGCVHAQDDALRYLMARVPLGTPVAILG